MHRLGIAPVAAPSGLAIAARSRGALDRVLHCEAELEVSVATDATCLVGAFQRVTSEPAPAQATARRGSGGPEVFLAPGTVHVALALRHPGALVPADEKHIVNRVVRPLLRALTRCGHLAHYFGRDWISVSGAPVGWVGFAHDAASRRTLFEAFVAVHEPFAREPRPSFRDRAPTALSSGSHGPVDPLRVANAVAEAYRGDTDAVSLDPWAPAGPTVDAGWTLEPAWSCSVAEAIGTVAAGRDASGVLRIGGDLLVSRDALARLEARVAQGPLDTVGHAVDEVLGAPGVALEGVRSLTSLRDVIVAARSA